MICLTIDVHHMGLKGVDQHFLDTTETEAARKFLDVVDEVGLNTTMFISGRCVEEHPDDVEALTSCPWVEVGGHNYRCFHPLPFFQVYGKITGLKNGPYGVQARDVKKTVQLLTEVTGVPLLSWRNHGYRGDRHTSEILAKNGVKFRSDMNDLNSLHPFHDGLLTVVPINTLPDHDYIDHGAEIEDFAATRKPLMRMMRTPVPRSLSIKDWMSDTLHRAENITAQGGIATILVHPACMEVIDQFQTLRIFLKSLKNQFGQGLHVRDTTHSK